jgi:hypothetical protein
MTGMGTADEQMAIRAQLALMRRMTSHLHFSPSTPIHAGTAAGRALRATIECSRGTTSDEEDDVEDEGDMPPPLEGEDDEDEGNVTSGVADSAAAVRRERMESGTPMIPIRSSAPSGIPLKAAPHKRGKFLVTGKVQPSHPSGPA